MIEDTGVIDEDVLNNNDSVDIKLEPHEIYDQVSCDFCEKVFNDKKALCNHIYDNHKVKESFCNSCVKSFKNHRAVKCKFCDKEYVNKKFLDRHITKVHNKQSTHVKGDMSKLWKHLSK